MSRLGLKQILGSLVVWLLFAPVILATGSSAFRWELYHRSVLGVPVFPLLVVVLLLVLMVLMWIFSSGAFSDADGHADEVRGDQQ